jgi:hypothetical protein
LKSLLCRASAFVGLVLVLLPAPARAQESITKAIPYVRLLEKYAAYEPLLDLVLEPMLTAQKTDTVVKVALGAPQAGARLEVFKFSGTIDVEGGDRCWLGNNWVKMRIPVDFRYEVDLKQLKPADFQYDAKRNVLEVKLPAVTMAKVVPDYAGLEVVEKFNPTFRSRASWYELKESILSEQVRPAAELLGQDKLGEASLVGRGVVQELLGNLYAPAKELKGIVIVVK